MLSAVAVDVGASSGKLFAVAFDGERLTLREVHRFVNEPVSVFGRLYWDIYRIFSEIRTGLLRAAADVHAESGTIASVGIDTWAVDYGLLDRRGHLLELPRHYRDTRTQGVWEQVVQQVGRSELFARTGIQLLPINTIFQLVAAYAENPEALEFVDRMLLIPDLLNYFLTGEKSAEFTNATTTQLFNPGLNDWDFDLIRQLSLPEKLFLPVSAPGRLLGPPLADPDLRTHPVWAHAQVVQVASHDTAAAVLAVPVRDEPYAFISSGTWSLLGTTVPKPVIDERTEQFNFTNEGGVGNYRLLKNIMGLWLLQEAQRVWAEQGVMHDIGQLLSAAGSAPPFASLFNPDDARLLYPGDIPERIREICRECGQRVPQTPGEVVRAILESLACKYRLVLEQLERVIGERIQTIHIVGGGSQNRLLCQLTANVTGRPVLAGPVEASALGNALMQLAALGEIGGIQEMRELIHRSFPAQVYEPEPGDLWESAYQAFLHIA